MLFAEILLLHNKRRMMMYLWNLINSPKKYILTLLCLLIVTAISSTIVDMAHVQKLKGVRADLAIHQAINQMYEVKNSEDSVAIRNACEFSNEYRVGCDLRGQTVYMGHRSPFNEVILYYYNSKGDKKPYRVVHVFVTRGVRFEVMP